jgi:hypothetical protein
MMPWERDIYLAMVKEWVEEENERIKKQRSSF